MASRVAQSGLRGCNHEALLKLGQRISSRPCVYPRHDLCLKLMLSPVLVLLRKLQATLYHFSSRGSCWAALSTFEVICAALYYWFEKDNADMLYCPARFPVAVMKSAASTSGAGSHFWVRMISTRRRGFAGIDSIPFQRQCSLPARKQNHIFLCTYIYICIFLHICIHADFPISLQTPICPLQILGL